MVEKIITPLIGSKMGQLDLESIKRAGRNFCIFYAPVLLYILNQLQAGTGSIDWKLVGSMSAGLIIDLVRRLLTDYSK